MPLTYYEVLNISSNATAAEIEAAYEAKYNHWRRLVTHHDPEMANRANQALRWLEQVQTTLLDPEKRAAYDAHLVLGSSTSGLADPQATPQPVTPPPPVPQKSKPVPPSAGSPVNAWPCPKCQTSHSVGTLYCTKCGGRLGLECPQCQEMIMVSSRFCPTCGVNVQDAIRQKEFEEAERQRRQQEKARRQAQKKAEEEAQAKALKRAKTRMAVIGGGIGIIAAPVAWAIIWPDMMDVGFCAVGQMLMGTIGGVATNLWAADSLVDPLKTENSIIVSIIGGILGGILAFPMIVIMLLGSML